MDSFPLPLRNVETKRVLPSAYSPARRRKQENLNLVATRRSNRHPDWDFDTGLLFLGVWVQATVQTGVEPAETLASVQECHSMAGEEVSKICKVSCILASD